jgi:5-methyltetrahydrofolate corrinoid/iron sulfur protein methyltransferase
MAEFEMLAEVLVPGCRSTCGLSNCSNGSPEHLRPILNQTYMIMLEKLGMKSCIVDAFDEDLRNIGRGGAGEIVTLIHQVMDRNDIDTESLSKEAVDYVKTAKVLLGHSLYSDSWLEL